MAINSDVDIPLAIEKLGKKPAVLALSNSNPPHTITVWTGGDARPSDSEINTAWNSYKTDQAAVKYKSDLIWSFHHAASFFVFSANIL